MVLSGPRQVGKTTLAKGLPGAEAAYLNWDVPEDRERILRREWPATPLLILDDIHKHRPWRGWLKGLYDAGRRRILVTGSARLDFYRHGGDSLQGRYHFLRLHPLSFAELGMKSRDDLQALMEFGGFPEPFLGGSAVEARRWSREYRTRLIREDLVSLERVQDLGTIELLMLRLPDLVGGPLSLNALREDLQVAHKTLSGWAEILERLYAIFRLAPFGSPRIRAVKKERKHYHYDWTLVPEPGPRFENLAASHLLKWVQYEEDTQGRDLELRYFRDVAGREVDFVVTERNRPLLLVECKLNDDALSPSLRYLKARFPSVPAWQIHAQGTRDVLTSEGIRIAPASALLSTLR
jgi:predicted AAA+ superfamily ATPase